MAGRSPATIVLAVGSVLVGLYSQFAAVALLVTGSAFAPEGSTEARVALLVGTIFLAITIAAYAVAYGFWAGHGWSRAGGVIVFGALIAASVMLSLLSTNIVSVIGPTIGGSVALWFLTRPGAGAHLSVSAAAGHGRAKAPTSPGSMGASRSTG